jgi:hypothetical protein
MCFPLFLKFDFARDNFLAAISINAERREKVDGLGINWKPRLRQGEMQEGRGRRTVTVHLPAGS